MKKILHIDGGIGRVVCSLPAIEKYAQNNKDLIVMTPWPGVFKNNCCVDEVVDSWGMEQQNKASSLWTKYISKNEYIKPEPYFDYNFYMEAHHIIESFNFLLNATVETAKPKFFLTNEEDNKAYNFIQRMKLSFQKIVVMQPFGSSAKKIKDKLVDESYRSLELDFVYEMLRVFPGDWGILYLGDMPLKHHRLLTIEPLSVRNIIALIKHCDAVITIDSVAQHIAYAYDKPTVVFWGASSFKNFGYSNFLNLKREGYPKKHLPLRVVSIKDTYNMDAMLFNNKEKEEFLDKILRYI